jgi:prolyl oligopeptidase
MPLDLTNIPVPVVENIHGERVVDPYRWLEDRCLPETNDWVHEQQQLCEKYFAGCTNLETIRARVRSYLDVEVLDQPSRVEDQYFYRRRNRGEEQGCIYTRDITTGRERLLVDPAAEGAFSSVSIYRISEDGSLMAYELRRGGEDKSAVAFIDVKHGSTFEDKLETGYLRGLVLRPEERGFYYCHENPSSKEEHAIRFRCFGDTGNGRVIFRAPRTCESRLILTADTTHLGAIWLHEGSSGLVTDLFIAALGTAPQWVKVFSDKNASFHPFLHEGRIFARYATGDEDSEVAEFSADGQKIRTVINGGALPIRQMGVAGDRIYANQFDYDASALSCWTLNGERHDSVDTPEGGTITLLPHRSINERMLFYSFESFHQPPTIFEYDGVAGRSRIFHQRPMGEQSLASTVTRHVFPAKDGTDIPITLVRMGDRLPDRRAPVILTVYGGFGAPITPQFSVLAIILMEGGATLALAHIRGGGEFGKRWHEAGSKRNRQTGIDDLLAAAEWLCNRGNTMPKQLGIFGGSNAGLMVAAAMTQRPDLFGAVLCIAPLLDMVRYEYFDRAARWRDEYGTVEDPEDFRALLSYSPYHRVEESIDYPPTMLVAGDRDDRCNPAHVRKMAACLQDRPAQTSPVIVDYSDQRGHMPTLPFSFRVEALSRRIAFLSRELCIAQPLGGHHETVCH